jgi:aminopeptidase-like protein
MTRLGGDAFEILNLVDGERSLLDIRDIVSFEFKETSIEYVLHFAEDLREMGLIDFR